jgi:hypothetical protein
LNIILFNFTSLLAGQAFLQKSFKNAAKACRPAPSVTNQNCWQSWLARPKSLRERPAAADTRNPKDSLLGNPYCWTALEKAQDLEKPLVAERFALGAGCHENQLTKRRNNFERKNAAKRNVANRPLAPKMMAGDHFIQKKQGRIGR